MLPADEERPAARDLGALKDVSFRGEAGTILGIVGPNGAAKTTLLEALARSRRRRPGTCGTEAEWCRSALAPP